VFSKLNTGKRSNYCTSEMAVGRKCFNGLHLFEDSTVYMIYYGLCIRVCVCILVCTSVCLRVCVDMCVYVYIFVHSCRVL